MHSMTLTFDLDLDLDLDMSKNVLEDWPVNFVRKSTFMLKTGSYIMGRTRSFYYALLWLNGARQCLGFPLRPTR